LGYFCGIVFSWPKLLLAGECKEMMVLSVALVEISAIYMVADI